MSSADNIKEIDIEYKLSYQAKKCHITTSVVLDTKQLKSPSVRMIDVRWNIFEKIPS